MARNLRQFEYDKPIEVMSRYTRIVAIPPKELWRVKVIINHMTAKYNVSVLNCFYDEKHIRLRLFFKKGCGCTLSRVMQWFLTRLSKCVNYVMKSKGKVFYDRYVSKILKLLPLSKRVENKKHGRPECEDKSKYTLESDPEVWTIPKGTNSTFEDLEKH